LYVAFVIVLATFVTLEDACQFNIFLLNICLLYNKLIILNPTLNIVAFNYLKIVYELLWKTKNEASFTVYSLDLS
jgi:hypothetical protein